MSPEIQKLKKTNQLSNSNLHWKICVTKDFGQFELVVFLPSHWIGCQGVRHHHQSRWQQLELITFARIVQYKLFWADYWSHSVALLGGGCQLCKAEICHILQKVIFCHQQNNFGDTDDGAGDFFPSSVFGCILYIFVEMSFRGAKTQNFPDSNFLRAITFRTKCAKPYLTTSLKSALLPLTILPKNT